MRAGLAKPGAVAPGSTSDYSDESYEFGWLEIESLAEGACQYTVTFTEGATGQGVSDQFSYPIEP